jgi:hypothetical protein
MPDVLHQLGPGLGLDREFERITDPYPVAAFSCETLPQQVGVDAYRSNSGHSLSETPKLKDEDPKPGDASS